MKNRHHVLAPLALFITALVVASPGASRAPRFDRQTPDQASPADAATLDRRGTAGLTATFDPETGELGRTAPELIPFSPEEINSLSTESDGLFEVRHPNGAVSIDLQGRFRSAAVATIGPDGAVSFRCVGSPGEAHSALCDHSTPSHNGLEVK